MGSMLIGAVAAAIFWLVIFGLKTVNFWWGMAIAGGILAIWSILWAGDERKRMFKYKASFFLWGVFLAAVLYFIFWIGDILSTNLFASTASNLESIYASREQLEAWKIALLLFFLIGPAEEIFWRGMVQRVLSKNFGSITGWLAASIIYAAVHVWSKNYILVIAALVGGLFWGWVYKRFGSLWPAMISHAFWDVAIFLIFPFTK